MAVFTNSQICDLRLREEELLASGKSGRMYAVQAEAARAVLENQSIIVDPFTQGDPSKDRVASVSYVDPCFIDDAACPDVCNFSGNDVFTKKANIPLDLCRSTSFAVDESDVAQSIFGKDDIVPIAINRALGKLDEWIAAQVLVALNANSGMNLYPTPYTYNAATASTDIPSGEYNLKIIPYFEKMAMLHEIEEPYYIDNGQLWIDWRNSQLNKDDCCGKGDANRANAINLYFDLKAFNAAGVAPDDTFLVGKHAVGIVSRAYNQADAASAETLNLSTGNQMRWKVPSNTLPGIEYDAFYIMECSGNRIKHSWMFKFTGGIFIAPAQCQPQVTGIMSFTAV